MKHDGVSSPANSAVDTYEGHVHTLRHSGREGASDLAAVESAGAWCSNDLKRVSACMRGSMCGMCAGLTASGPEVALLGSTLGVPCILCDGL